LAEFNCLSDVFASSWAEFRRAFSLSLVAGGLVAPAGGTWRLQWTNAAIGCNNWLMNIQKLFQNYSKIILFHFRRGSMLK